MPYGLVHLAIARTTAAQEVSFTENAPITIPVQMD